MEMNRREFAGGLAGFVAAFQVKLPELAKAEGPIPIVATQQPMAAELARDGNDGPILLPLKGLIDIHIDYGKPIDITSTHDSSRQFMPPPPGSEMLTMTFRAPHPLSVDVCSFDREIRVNLPGMSAFVLGRLVALRDSVRGFDTCGTRELVIRPTEPVVWT